MFQKWLEKRRIKHYSEMFSKGYAYAAGTLLLNIDDFEEVSRDLEEEAEIGRQFHPTGFDSGILRAIDDFRRLMYHFKKPSV